MEGIRHSVTYRFHTLRLLTLAAWLYRPQGQESIAAGYLEEAITTSESSRYLRPILDIPDLQELVQQSNHPFARRLLKRWPLENGAVRVEALTPEK